MGALAFSDLTAITKVRLGSNPQWDSMGGVDYHGLLVNQAYKQLTSSHRLPIIEKSFTFPQLHVNTTSSTVDGQAYINVPDYTLRIRHVFDNTSKVKLDWMPVSWYVGQTDRSTAASEGAPQKWTRDGGRIWLWPTPDAVYSLEVWYRRTVADLSSSQVTLIGAEWDPAILALAAYKGHLWMGDYEKVKADKEEYLDIVTGLIGVYNREEQDRNEHILADPDYLRYKR